MKKIITALLMGVALVGYVGLPSLQAADMNNNNGPKFFDANSFADTGTHNQVRDRDSGRKFHIGDGETPSHYPPYYTSGF